MYVYNTMLTFFVIKIFKDGCMQAAAVANSENIFNHEIFALRCTMDMVKCNMYLRPYCTFCHVIVGGGGGGGGGMTFHNSSQIF